MNNLFEKFFGRCLLRFSGNRTLGIPSYLHNTAKGNVKTRRVPQYSGKPTTGPVRSRAFG